MEWVENRIAPPRAPGTRRTARQHLGLGDGIEAGERFVQNQHARAVHQGAEDLDALSVALGEGLEPRPLPPTKPDALQQRVGGVQGRAAIHALEPAVEGDRLARTFAREQAALLGQETDLAARPGVGRPPEQADHASVRAQKSQHTAQGRALSRAVDADEPGDAAGRRGEADVLDPAPAGEKLREAARTSSSGASDGPDESIPPLSHGFAEQTLTTALSAIPALPRNGRPARALTEDEDD